MNPDRILDMLPYAQPFLFVDTLSRIDDAGVEGSFLFRGEMEFYKGHFKDRPVTPGVILTECCAQIGVVCLGIFLQSQTGKAEVGSLSVALSQAEMEFYLPVFPGERVIVRSEKQYFRFSKLKCKVRMYNEHNQLVCKGLIAGMFKSATDV